MTHHNSEEAAWCLDCAWEAMRDGKGSDEHARATGHEVMVQTRSLDPNSVATFFVLNESAEATDEL